MQTPEFQPTQEFKEAAPLLEDGTRFDLHKSKLLPLEQVQAMAATAAAYDLMSQNPQPLYEGHTAPQSPELPRLSVTDDNALSLAPVITCNFRRTELSDKPSADIDTESILRRAA